MVIFGSVLQQPARFIHLLIVAGFSVAFCDRDARQVTFKKAVLRQWTAFPPEQRIQLRDYVIRFAQHVHSSWRSVKEPFSLCVSVSLSHFCLFTLLAATQPISNRWHCKLWPLSRSVAGSRAISLCGKNPSFSSWQRVSKLLTCLWCVFHFTCVCESK